jgi:hypothetical protein
MQKEKSAEGAERAFFVVVVMVIILPLLVISGSRRE